MVYAGVAVVPARAAIAPEIVLYWHGQDHAKLPAMQRQTLLTPGLVSTAALAGKGFHDEMPGGQITLRTV